MERVLCNSELISLIFNHLGGDKDANDILSCALTCKSWSEPALDELWRNLEHLDPLLSLLAPVKEVVHDAYSFVFKRPIHVSDWSVFERYAHRVRGLNLDFDLWELSHDMFYEVAQKRPFPILLPRLTRLRMSLDMEGEFIPHLSHSFMFMSESIRDFSLCLPHPDYDEFMKHVPEFFEELTRRMPNLRKFELFSEIIEWPIASIEEHVVKWISTMPNLEAFTCCEFFATSSIMSALSELPSLREVEINEACEGYGRGKDVREFQVLIAPGAFAALSTLEFCAEINDAITFLQMDFAPGLAGVFLHSPQLETAEALRQLFSSLSKARPSLRLLRLDSVHLVNNPLMGENGQETDCVTLGTLEPLLSFHKLVDVRISYHRQFQLDEYHLEKLLEDWRHLECLCLCSDPILEEEPILAPTALYLVARHCPRICHLELYINTSVQPCDDRFERACFQSLKGIEFGTSQLEDEEDIPKFALFLSRILPKTCEVDSLSGWSRLRGRGITLWSRGRSYDNTRWNKVSWLTKVLIAARAEERRAYGELATSYNNLMVQHSRLLTELRKSS